MSDPARLQTVSGFARGFFAPFRALRFIAGNPGLYGYVVFPFSINVGVFTLVVWQGLHFFQTMVVERIPQGEAWYWAVLYYLLWLLALLVTAVLVFFTFTVLGALIASPFNDLLSERTEELLAGKSQTEPFSPRALMRDARDTLVRETKKISVFLGGMLLLLLLNIIPVAGSILYSGLSFFWTVFFLVVEYTGYTLSRKRLSFGEQKALILGNFTLMFGFGCGLLLVLAIPFLQLLCIPLGVVAATRILVESGNLPVADTGARDPRNV